MGVTLTELNYIATRSDLVELERKLSQQYATLLDEIKRSRVIEQVAAECVTDGKEFLSIPEFAKITGRSWQTVKNWIMAGVINGAQPEGKGCGWIIPIPEIEKVREMCNL